ncbi:MAG TPA: TatD family hydrolase [Tepidisphaeraceae bacterium]|jgi:TatD DNase family protein
MIDSHCHLTDPRLLSQLDAVLDRAAAAGVNGMVTIGTTPDDAERAIAICERHPQVRCAIGVHPNHSHEVGPEAINCLRELAASPTVVAIGEMGLDYFHQYADRRRQRQFFEAQLALASDLGKPVVIHSREAIDDALAVTAGFPGVRCVFHCFTGSIEEADRIAEAGHWLGFTGPITFKKNDLLRECVRRTAINQLLIETDAPYLSPEPVRSQKTNEPSFVAHTLAKVAEIKGMLVRDADRRISWNTKAFYGMPNSDSPFE